MYRVGIIENDKSVLKTLELRLGKNFKVIPLELKIELDELVLDAIEEKLDLVIVDHLFSDTEPTIQYTGTDIVNKLHDEVLNYPAVILTSHEDDAEREISEAYMPYLIFEKRVISTKELSDYFVRKLTLHIEKYKNNLKDKQSELLALIDKRKSEGELSYTEEERVIELDNFLEKSLRKKSSIPSSLKSPSVNDDLSKLISMTEEILRKVDGNEKE